MVERYKLNEPRHSPQRVTKLIIMGKLCAQALKPITRHVLQKVPVEPVWGKVVVSSACHSPSVWRLLLAKWPQTPHGVSVLQGSWLLILSTKILGSIQAMPQIPTHQIYFSNTDTAVYAYTRSGNSSISERHFGNFIHSFNHFLTKRYEAPSLCQALI